MNLIEQLGGYEKAKNHRDYLIDFGNEFNRPNKYEVNKINNALLEYRRQHNVYEAGDDVVLIGGNCTLLYKLYEIIGKYVYLKRPSGREYDFHIDEVRHATDAEIKAGRRL